MTGGLEVGTFSWRTQAGADWRYREVWRPQPGDGVRPPGLWGQVLMPRAWWPRDTHSSAPGSRETPGSGTHRPRARPRATPSPRPDVWQAPETPRIRPRRRPARRGSGDPGGRPLSVTSLSAASRTAKALLPWKVTFRGLGGTRIWGALFNL